LRLSIFENIVIAKTPDPFCGTISGVTGSVARNHLCDIFDFELAKNNRKYGVYKQHKHISKLRQLIGS
jgi:hypothetical protein